MHVKGSKTDQFREEATIVLDATGGELCPVAALLQYANLRGSALGPLFRFEIFPVCIHDLTLNMFTYAKLFYYNLML